jgi:hypothetical protein
MYYERIDLPEGARLQFRQRTIISTVKVVVSIFWSLPGCLVIAALVPRTKLTAAYFCGEIIPKIVEGMPFDLAMSTRQVMPHMDKATPPIRGINEMFSGFRIRPIEHPPYPLDLAPSDFYLSGKLKGDLAGKEFDCTEELLLTIKWIADSVGRAELELVFDAWERKLSERSQMKSEYIT